MNHDHIEAFSKIEQPPRDSFGFIEDIKSPLSYHFEAGQGCDPGKTASCMKDGVTLDITFPRVDAFPDTAFLSLRRVLAAKGVTEKAGVYTITFAEDKTLSEEEFSLKVTPEGTLLSAADPDGLRRGVYFLEDRICEAEGPSITEGAWQRKPFVKHRVSRCFFGPTNRAPFFIDELTNDVDYYPEEYLNKLAHEGVNGLWLTMYFRDLPSSIFPGRGQEAPKRFAKLRQTVEKCARYGVKIYVFLSEPKLFGPTHYAVPMEDAEAAPEVMKVVEGKFGYFCTSSEAGRKYLEESMDCIFRNVPELGGVINIMLGEDNGSCIARETTRGDRIAEHAHCPLCSQRDFADLYSEQAQMYTEVMHKYNPKAEYIAWFYAPGQRDDSPFMQRLLHVAEKWPEGCSLMFNFESGGAAYQQGKKHTVFDYSLAYVGPSKLFAQSTEKAPRTAAKLQVGCSHEDASVPFIPVPENLYDKYKFMNEHGVTGAMQCWYFGNYPGLMNKAAGMLSFDPFPAKGMDFLEELARPDWRKYASSVAKAWNYFSTAYRLFPANLSFEWYGPLHHSIAWPLHLFPVDEPISPSWILKNYPEVSGDRIGECLGYQHTLGEALELCIQMSDTWEKGMEILKSLRDEFKNDPARQADINLAQAVGIQMKSTRNLLQFYFWREEMLYDHVDHLAEMKQIVQDEIALSKEMMGLCQVDCRLGYHSEAEGYLFFPEKLRARIQLLEELLAEDFPRFRLDDPSFKEYSGETPCGNVANCYRKGAAKENTFAMGAETSWQMSYDDDYFYFRINNVAGNTFEVVLEPCRLWTPYHMVINADRTFGLYSGIFPDMPEENVTFDGNDVLLRVERKLFNGFYREGFPLRFNIYSNPSGKFAWCEPELWPSRLQHGSYNPQTSGWIVLK